MALPRLHRLKKNADFLGILRGRTKRIETAFGGIVVARHGVSPRGQSGAEAPPSARFGFVVSKKVSSRSTARNLLKRRASEWVRKHLFLFKDSPDVVFLFKKDATSFSRRALYEELERACKRAGLFKIDP